MEFKEYFQQPYQGGDSFLQEVVFPIFGEETFENRFYTSILDENPELETIARTTGIESICLIGTIQVEFNPIDIFDIKVTNHVQMARNRVAIQQLVRRIMNTYSSAFMIFHYEDTKNWDWRFTFCSKKGSNDDTTDSKRYTFLLGPNQSCRTASENFCKLLQKHGDIEVKDIEAAFDVEALSKEFFCKYKQHYLRFVDYMCNDENGIRQSFIDTSFDHTEMDAKKIKDREEKPIRDYVKKLLGRIVFLHFLQKKGWMGVPQDKPWGQGDTNFMKHLFEKCTEDQKENFLDKVLEPLFSDALDTDRSSDDFLFDTNVKLDCGSVVKIPYLNGGLFERDYLDEPETRFPVEYFADLFEFFYQYNFTIDENDPNDAQLGVDPEMLGRIFENLLEDNKDKGAFYTPKEIVQYMCRQSLIAYLQTDVDNEETKTAIESFVKTYNVELLGGTDSELSKSLDNRLKDVKICDPAIGSGAFPMGLLKELFLCRGAIEKFDDAASIKRHIIQQNIYGVDIERGAVDIARLRFWLSLIVDEETPHSLPNLDYKIMQGNSLLESFMGLDLSTLADDQIKIAKKNRGQVSFIFDEADTKKNIQIYLEQYFSESNHSSKSQIRQAIENTVKEHIKICAGYDSKVVTAVDNLTIPNDKFFLWHTYFSDVFNRPSGCNGFDIVIGNPPYGAKLSVFEKNILKKLYTTAQSIKNVQKGSLDTYTMFIELAYNMLCKNGCLAMIVPISLTSSDSSSGVHRLLLTNCDDIQVSSYAVRPQPVFENAVVNTSIITFRKTLNQCERIYSTKMYRKGRDFNLHSLVDSLEFIEVGKYLLFGRIPKVSKQIELNILDKLFSNKRLSESMQISGSPIIYRFAGGRYFKVITNYSNGSSAERTIYFKKSIANAIGCILSSNLSFWFYQIYSDNLNWKNYEISEFRLPPLSADTIKQLDVIYNEYLADIELNANIRQTSGSSSYNVNTFKEYKIGKSKAIIDRIDDIICPLYSLTQEETEFIKKYEIEFRLSDDE
nr:N-6 DNA methylase [uncultured Bacteroides sp.]